jgi:hypothetical protein
VRIIFSSLYALLVTILALVSRSTAVTPQWYLAPVIAFLISLIATMTTGPRVSPSKSARIAVRASGLMIGTSLILIFIFILTHLSQVKNITISLQPGIFGGILLLFLNVLYLPNAAVAIAAYFSGTGVAVGAGTLVSPLWYHLGQIPALPLLGILPTGRQPIALLGVIFFIGLGVLLALWSLPFGIQTLIQSYIFLIAISVALAYCASGSLITSEMGAMGVSIWKFVLSIAIEVGIGAAALFAIKSRSSR